MPREQCTCDYCGGAFTPSHNHGQRFCSKACMGLGMRAEKSPHWKGDTLSLVCTACGKSFRRAQETRRPDRERVYCSRECKTAHMSGENSPKWKGGRFLDADGYVRIYVGPGHPAAFTATNHAHEHVVIAMELLGRSLQPGELVHHRDGNRANNDPANLEVLSGHSEHVSLHHAMRRAKMKPT